MLPSYSPTIPADQKRREGEFSPNMHLNKTTNVKVVIRV